MRRITGCEISSATLIASIASTKRLHARDCEREGFQWIVAEDADNSVFAFARLAKSR